MEISFDIAPYLKKYVIKQYGQEPIKVERYSILGRLVFQVIKEEESIVETDRPFSGHHGNGEAKNPLSARLRIILNQDMKNNSPRQYKLLKINYPLARLFKDHLIIWIEAQQKMGVPPSSGCKNFLDHFRIDEGEYSYDGAHKVWLRRKK